MNYTSIKVLVIDSDGKQPYSMIRGLKEIGCHVTVICSSKMDSCYVSKKPDVKILNKEFKHNNKNKYQYLLSLVSTGQYDVLMPVGEMSTDFITQHENELNKYVKIACAPRQVYLQAFNKQNTFDQAMKSGIPCPYTRRSDQDINDYLQNAHFPIIIKPRQGIGSIGFHKFESQEDFVHFFEKEKLNIDDYVIQEFVKFDNRIGTNLFVDQKGNICTSYAVDVLRWFPIDAGAGVLIQTVDAHEILEYAGRLLKDLGWKGFANVAFMIDKESGEPKLMEINGRIPASIKVAFMLGFNISKQFIEMIYDEDVTVYPENTQFGKYVRHFDTDIAWFIKSPNRFRAKPSWFSWKNTEEVLFSKDDPMPFFAQFFKKVLSYRAIMKKKKH